VENHNQTWARVRRIAERLAGHAEGGDVLLCAHGYLNWMVDQQLRKNGWVRTERDGGNHYWSWRIYEAPGLCATANARTAAAE